MKYASGDIATNLLTIAGVAGVGYATTSWGTPFVALAVGVLCLVFAILRAFRC